MTKRYLILVVLLLLAACGGGEAEPTAVPEQAPAVEEAAVEEAPLVEAPTAVPEQAPADAPAAGAARTYTIVEEATEASFTLDEELRGAPTTVVGSTSAVSGSVTLDLSNPAAAELSPIVIDAATLATDSGMRDRAIGRFILVTGSFPEIVFTPTSLEGLPDSVTQGEPVTFLINGDLDITDITIPVMFEATVTAVSDTRLEGSASSIVNRTDFGLEIPNVPNVANVAEEVLLQLTFVAEASE